MFRGLLGGKIWHIAALVFLVTMAYFVYDLQLQYTNAYVGYLPVVIRFTYVLQIIISCILLGLMIPKKIERPSDIFVLFNVIFVVLSYSVFYAATSEIGIFDFAFRFVLVALPCVVMWLAGLKRFSLVIPFNLRTETVFAIAAGMALTGAAVAILNTGVDGGFSIEGSYDRRLAGRDVFAAGSLIAYLNVMSMNGITPFLAFLGGITNRKSMAVIACLLSVAYFYSIGVKAPFAFVGLAYIVGIGVRTGNLNIVFKLIVLSTTLLFVGFAIEFYVNGYSEIAEYFFRRVYVIPGFDVERYMELLFERAGSLWSPLWGVSSDLSVTYLVGATFFGNDKANVNTNAFTYALAAGGFFGYFAIVVLVTGFMKLLDALYEGSSNVSYLYIGFLFSILLTEQAATTAFVSSGVGLLFLLVVLSGRGWQMAPRSRSVGVSLRDNVLA